MTEKPWWRRWNGLPQGSRDNGRLPMSRGEVWVTRLMTAGFVIGGVVLAVITRRLTPLVLVVLPLAAVRRLPDHQRRQVLGRTSGT